MNWNIKVRISDDKVMAGGYCDFTPELGTVYEQYEVSELEKDQNKLANLRKFDITRNPDGTFTVT